MPRLFVTPRDLNFVSDINKELIKDVNGQRIYYYPISEIKTLAHDVYNEAVEKIYDNPIAIDALVSAIQQQDARVSATVDKIYQVEVYIQYRDLVDKGIKISIGDFFSYGDIFYEISNQRVQKDIWGQVENKNDIVLVGTKARENQFKAKLFGPTDMSYSDDDAIRKEFYQQRGLPENAEGETGDKRELIENEVIDKPLTGQREVSERGALADNSNYASSFYEEDDY